MKVPTVFNTSQPPETNSSITSSAKSSKSPRSTSRSVRGMKSLLPLHLSPSVPTSQVFEARQEEASRPSPEVEDNRRGFFSRRRRSSRTRRGGAIYTPAEFPLPQDAFYSQQDSPKKGYSMPAPPRRPIIVNDYELSDSEEVDATPPPRHTVNLSKDYRSPRWGGLIRDDVLDTVLSSPAAEPTIFVEENDATWLDSSHNHWNDGREDCLPYVLSQSMPVQRWLNDTPSWVEDEDDNVLACATTVAPAKAHVVQVNKKDSGLLNVEVIPPRTSSLDPPEETRTSWMTFGDCDQLSSYSSFLSDTSSESGNHEEEIDEDDLTVNPTQLPPPRPNSKFVFLTEPPQSPTSLAGDSTLPSVLSPPVMENVTRSVRSSPKRNSLHETISDLETHLSAFPTWMMLEDSNCVSSIRSYLQLPSSNLTVQRRRPDPPLSPALSQDSPFLDASTALESNPFDSQLPTIPNAFTQSLLDSTRDSFGADLGPLERIFPDSTIFMQSALYAHLLAYIFVTSLGPALNIIPATPPMTSPRSSTLIPSKAAELLGLNPDLIIPSATKALEDQLVNHIGTLVNDMENPPGTATDHEPVKGISRIMLMSLVEVVRAAEGA